MLDDSQVKALCKDGALARAQSCIFHPKGPSEVDREGDPTGEVPPVVYVEVPHVYYSTQVPKQPPCPKHGWESIGEVGAPLRTGWRPRPRLGIASGKRGLLHSLCLGLLFCFVLSCLLFFSPCSTFCNSCVTLFLFVFAVYIYIY